MELLHSSSLAGWAAEVAFTGLFKGGLLLVAAWLLVGRAKSRSAATRYAVWALAVGGLLALPILPLAFSGVNLGLVESPAFLGDLPAGSGPSYSVAAPAIDPSGAAATETSIAASTLWQKVAPALLVVWGLGTGLLLLRLIVDWIRVVRITSAAGRHGLRRALTRRAIVLARRQGVQRSIRVVVSDEMLIPVTWGVVRPVVILPNQATGWDRGHLDAVLLHELAHISRWDYLTHMVGEIARALYWPNPLTWMALKRWRMERERACDDAVLRFGTTSADYATLLLDVARSLSSGRTVVRGAMAMARPSMLETRINGVLDRGSNRCTATYQRVAIAALLLIAVMAPVGTLRVWASPPQTEAQWIEALSRRDPLDRRGAIEVLEMLGTADAVDALIQLIEDPHPNVRAAAVSALGRIGDTDAIPTLVGIVTGSHGDLYQKRLATVALGEIDDRAALAALGAQLDTRGAEGRGLTRRARRPEPDPSVWAPLVTILLEDPNPEARSLAASALVEIGCESAIPELLSATEDPEADVRLAAVNALAAFKTWPVRDALDDLAEADPDPRVRRAATDALECDDL